jgi:hypothetical protein
MRLSTVEVERVSIPKNEPPLLDLLTFTDFSICEPERHGFAAASIRVANTFEFKIRSTTFASSREFVVVLTLVMIK